MAQTSSVSSQKALSHRPKSIEHGYETVTGPALRFHGFTYIKPTITRVGEEKKKNCWNVLIDAFVERVPSSSSSTTSFPREKYVEEKGRELLLNTTTSTYPVPEFMEGAEEKRKWADVTGRPGDNRAHE